MKYRKKPVVIEAMRYTPETCHEIHEWMGYTHDEEYPESPCSIAHLGFHIETLEGEMRADVGDWIVKGVKGEFYPIKDDIFRETYEAVEK